MGQGLRNRELQSTRLAAALQVGADVEEKERVWQRVRASEIGSCSLQGWRRHCRLVLV